MPKFTLLQAFNTGKTAGKEIMILQLEQLMLNYAKTPEGIKAKEMLKILKSDLKVEQFDENGNPIQQNKPQEEKSQETALPPTDEDVKSKNLDGAPVKEEPATISSKRNQQFMKVKNLESAEIVDEKPKK